MFCCSWAVLSLKDMAYDINLLWRSNEVKVCSYEVWKRGFQVFLSNLEPADRMSNYVALSLSQSTFPLMCVSEVHSSTSVS